MTEGQWNTFVKFRTEFAALCKEWEINTRRLLPLVKEASLKDTPEYSLENAVVYNTDYDKIKPSDEIKLIVIGDNPGKEEQLNCNRRYLCGQSGRLAEGFFNRTPDLQIDFRKNAIIVNKTPIHTAKTLHLKHLAKSDPHIAQLIKDSQLKMAELTAELHQGLVACKIGSYTPEIWLVGYSELKEKGIFGPYRNALKAAYNDKEVRPYWEFVEVYQHFSMNCFNKDYNKALSSESDLSPAEILKNLGHQHRNEIFGEL